MNRARNYFSVKSLCMLLVLSAISFTGQNVNAAEGWGEFDRMQIQMGGDSFSNAHRNLSSNSIASIYKERNGVIELLPIIFTNRFPYTALIQPAPNVKEPIWAERLESNHQFNDGRWCLTDSNKENAPVPSIWQGSFDPTRPGSYHAVEILQGCGTGHGGSEMNLKIHNTSLVEPPCSEKKSQSLRIVVEFCLCVARFS